MSKIPNELDEQYVFAVQDPSDPVWAADGDIADMQQVDDPNDMVDQRQPTTIRTASGGLDFLNDLQDVVEDLFEVETTATKPKKGPKLDDIRTRELGSDKWRPDRRFVETVAVRIVAESEERRQVTLINFGPGSVYLSNISGAVANGMNTVRLPVSGVAFWAPLTIPTRDDIWAICNTGDTAVVDIVEIFDMEC